MDVKQLVQDEDAVSPVIGVILMVAITVILAAVIGTFVLGLGDQVQDSAPNANFQFEYGTTDLNDGSNTATVQSVTITHNGGQDVDGGNIDVLIGGDPAYGITGSPDESDVLYSDGTTYATGDSVTAVFVDTDGPSNNNDFSTATAIGNDGSTIDSPSDADTIADGEDVLIVWTSPNGDSSNTIGSSTVPS